MQQVTMIIFTNKTCSCAYEHFYTQELLKAKFAKNKFLNQVIKLDKWKVTDKI